MATKSVLSEHYEKGEVTVKDKDPKADFKDLPENILVVRVKRGSKVKNIMGFVEKTLKDESNRQLVFSGCGDAIEKTITCVEITKTKFKGLHQITKLSVLSVLEFWEPKQPELDRLQVTREIPTVSILLSKDQLDSNELGYQAPSSKDKSPKKSFKRKKTDQRPKNQAEVENSVREKVVEAET
ncbi:Ribonuclease P protein subunit p25-like [Argiope bruennichi]|uniref:Ribonuclease P protein subunit p25-like n=1 Tax=Argiope bruennichi TaxID=94029 RepID=A0A8T0FTK8_ARGBR|nr:Ribonuclease P protein subunit p25-like [Argiope bruennichi]